MKELRGRRGWTAAELGERLAKQGVRWDRFTVAGLESGKRQNVSVSELLALALVLDVAPVNLLVPVEDVPYQVTPTRIESADAVRAWVRGEVPLAAVNERTFYTEVSVSDLTRQQGQRAEWGRDHPLRVSRGGALYDAQGNRVDDADGGRSDG
ncbi:helix-turn-helix domain-containing protein [Streptomyces chryseus]